MLLLMSLLACKDDPPVAGEGALPIASYHGLQEDNTWTWRDDGGDEEPDSEQLLKARLEGESMVIRRGSRWVDGEDVGYLEWSTAGGLSLVGWELGSESGTGDAVFVNSSTTWNSATTTGGWTCANEYSESFETWYALFDDAAVFTCRGDGGPDGVYAFAQLHGLIYAEVGGTTLDLVAAW